MSYVNFYGPSISDLVAQQHYEQRLANYRYRETMAYRRQQEEMLRQQALAEEQAYLEAVRRAYLQEQLEAERAEYLRLKYEAQMEEQLREQLARREAARQEVLLQEAARAELARIEAARLDAVRQEAARVEAARQKAARKEAARQEAARQEAARQEAARQEAARQEAARQEAARQEAARQEAARQEAEADSPKESANSIHGQQKYKVVAAPFPYFGYYLVPLDEDAQMSESSDNEGSSEEEKESNGVAHESNEIPRGCDTECTTPEEQSDLESHKATEKRDINDDKEADSLSARVVQSLSEALSEVEDQTKSSVPTSASKSEPADSDNANASLSSDTESDTVSRLEKIQKEVDSLVETYERIFKSETSSGSESDASFSSSVINSRIKVLQRGQLRLEQLYSELDELSNVPKSYKKLKRTLTSRSVSYAEKIEDFLRVLEDHKVAARNEEEEGKSIQVPPELKKLRRVTIEAVDDDSDF